MSELLLKIVNVCHNYGKVQVLENLNLTIQHHGIVGIYGKSGAGKSTLFGIIGGLLKPKSGKVFIEERDVYSSMNTTLSVRRRLGFVFQLFNLIPELTVYKNIEIALKLREGRSDPQQIRQLLREMHIEDLEGRYPSELSVGEQQRVAIARAVVGSPKLVLADEPTGSVDEHNKQGILELFKKVKARGITLLITSHDLSTLEICDRVLELREGKLWEVQQ